MQSHLVQAAPLLSSKAAVTNGWRSPLPAEAELGKPLSYAHGDATPPSDGVGNLGALGRAESAASAGTAYFDAGSPLLPVPCILQVARSASSVPPRRVAELTRSALLSPSGHHKYRRKQGRVFWVSPTVCKMKVSFFF